MHHSLQGKVRLGYYVVAAAIFIASLFFVGELRTLEARVVQGLRATELFNTVLEIRRFERNYFLHRQSADLRESIQYVQRAEELLARNAADFAAITTAARLAALRGVLDAYRVRMAELAAAPLPLESAEPEVRRLGQEAVALAEDMAAAERHQLRATLATFSSLLLGVILGMVLLIILIGRALSLRVCDRWKKWRRASPRCRRTGGDP